MKRIIATRRRRLAALVAVTGLIGVGVAIAAWTISGTGTGFSQATPVLTNLTIAPATSASEKISPGNAASIDLQVTNPVGNGPLVLTSWQTPGTGNLLSSDPTNCPASNVSRTDALTHTINVPIAAGATVQLPLPDAVP